MMRVLKVWIVYVPMLTSSCRIWFILDSYVDFRQIIVFLPLSDSMNILFGCKVAAWCAIFRIWVMLAISGWMWSWCMVTWLVWLLVVSIDCMCIDGLVVVVAGCRAKAFSMFLSQAICSCL